MGPIRHRPSRLEFDVDLNVVVGHVWLELVVSLPAMPGINLIDHDQPLAARPTIELAPGDEALAGEARIVPPDQVSDDPADGPLPGPDRKSTRLNSSH